jgi:dimethylargininase
MLTAITREVSPSIARCELTHLERQPIDYDRARLQHHAYLACLEASGCAVVSLPADPELPDSVFVEDIALVLDELAVITRPGAASRRPETQAVAKALEPYRPLQSIQLPAALDGGDVLRIDKKLFVGLSSRSTPQGVSQLRQFVEPFGYTVTGIQVDGCLHLKSAVTQVGENLLLLNPAWVDKECFPGRDFLEIDPSEPFGANALLLNGRVIYPAAYSRTLGRLVEAGIQVVPVEADELAKAEGGVTCCSLIFNT